MFLRVKSVPAIVRLVIVSAALVLTFICFGVEAFGFLGGFTDPTAVSSMILDAATEVT